ncbi:MAG: hypothetical protein PHQ86_06445 [Dehalococcoidales bacterium]|nr:hypothetical protein [Dehalococcoidales bacterium]
MRVLVACEESQVVCIAFREIGHEAYSCDTQECSGGHPEWHIQDDVIKHLRDGWDLMIGHPPCTYISYAGTRWWNDDGRVYKRLEALKFFADLWTAPINKICLENPRSCASPTIAKYSQEINPFYFGDEATKPTWLWLKNLPKLKHIKQTDMFDSKTHVGRGEFVYHTTIHGKIKGDSKWYTEAFSLPPEERARLRSKTFPGIAQAMAEQWGNL